MNTISVIIANPDDSHRARCRALLEGESAIEILAETTTVKQTLDAVKATPAHVLLLHHATAGPDFPVAIRSVLDGSPLTEVLALAEGADDPRILDLLSAGARGYLLDADLDRLLVKAVRKVHEGEAWVPRKMVTQILRRLAWLSRAERSPGLDTPSSRYA